MTDGRITCAHANELRTTLRPLSSLTNYVDGEVLDPHLPGITSTIWGHDDGTEVMGEELDARGCHHWLITPKWNTDDR